MRRKFPALVPRGGVDGLGGDTEGEENQAEKQQPVKQDYQGSR